MNFFNKAKAVRLRSHLDKYLAADDDQQAVRQSRSLSRKSRWLVEFVHDSAHVVRLKNCHGKYLTASNVPFLLGMTGNKVLQTVPENMKDQWIEWEPIRDGFQVKLRAFGGTYLRANGGTPPWRNSVTHDNPSSAHSWILWDVEVVEVPEDEPLADYLSMISSFSSVSEEQLSGLELGSPLSSSSSSSIQYSSNNYYPRFLSERSFSPQISTKKKYIQSRSQIAFAPPAAGAVMDLFRNAKAVRLRSHHHKYLVADDDEESVSQDRNASAKKARWTVEFVENTSADSNNVIIRLKSCYGKYLTASNIPFLLGMTGRKVLQTLPSRLDSSVEWEPIREGNLVKLKTRYGQFLRANGGLPPWRNSVTHDIPHRTATQDWIFWGVDIVEIVVVKSPAAKPPPQLVPHTSDSFASSESSSPSTHLTRSPSFSRQESADSLVSSPPKRGEGRTIYYHVADESGDVDEGVEGIGVAFKGNGVDDLTRRLQDETGLEDVVICTRSPLNGKLYPLRLQLPPNNVTMYVVVVRLSSKVARDFAKSGMQL